MAYAVTVPDSVHFVLFVLAQQLSQRLCAHCGQTIDSINVFAVRKRPVQNGVLAAPDLQRLQRVWNINVFISVRNLRKHPIFIFIDKSTSIVLRAFFI